MDGKKRPSSTCFKKVKKKLRNVHKIEGAHLQCVNNHYAKFEYEGLNTVRVSELYKLGTPLEFWIEKMSKFNMHQKSEKKL